MDDASLKDKSRWNELKTEFYKAHVTVVVCHISAVIERDEINHLVCCDVYWCVSVLSGLCADAAKVRWAGGWNTQE